MLKRAAAAPAPKPKGEHLSPASPTLPLTYVCDFRGVPFEFSYAGVVARIIDAGEAVC